MGRAHHARRARPDDCCVYLHGAALPVWDARVKIILSDFTALPTAMKFACETKDPVRGPCRGGRAVVNIRQRRAQRWKHTGLQGELPLY
ncbi:MAG: hypothetical protein ACJAVM_000747 [Sulfitobacter sp.]|jgi:hypothetical protein